MSDFTQFPPQTAYTPVPPQLLAGHRYSSNVYEDDTRDFIIPLVADLPSIHTATVTSNNGDNVALTIDGVTVTTPGTGSDNADAASLAALISAQPALSQVVSAAVATNVITITGLVAGVSHTVVDASAGASSIAVVAAQAASAYSRVTYGMGVVRATGIRGTDGAVKPTSASETFCGVVVLRSDCDSLDGTQASLLGFDPLYLIPGSARYEMATSGGIVVDITGAVAQGDPVYLDFSTANGGKFGNASGAVSQVMELTFAGGGGGGTAAGSFDGLPTITVADDTDDATNAAAWADAFNANAQYAAIATASANAAVVTVTSEDAIVFTDASAGGPSITDAVTTAAVAPVAQLIPGARFLLSSPGDRAPIEFNVSVTG
jgi:hypothetical protein